MASEIDSSEPDWDTPLALTITPGMIIHALMGTATAAHTGWSSCIDDALVLSDQVAMDDRTGHYIRLVEQEFVEEDQPGTLWHDWSLEVRIGSVLTIGHWQFPASAHPLEWDWHTREAARAFERACVLLGRRVRRTVSVEDAADGREMPSASRH